MVTLKLIKYYVNPSPMYEAKNQKLTKNMKILAQNVNAGMNEHK